MKIEKERKKIEEKEKQKGKDDTETEREISWQTGLRAGWMTNRSENEIDASDFGCVSVCVRVFKCMCGSICVGVGEREHACVNVCEF